MTAEKITPSEVAENLFHLDFEPVYVCEVDSCGATAERVFRHPAQKAHMVCQRCAIRIRLEASTCASNEAIFCALCNTDGLKPPDIHIGGIT